MKNRTLLTVVVATLGCSGSERLPAGPLDPNPGGPAQAVLTVQVALAPEDSSVAQALGWEGGVPGAEVRYLRLGTSEWQVRTSDANGVAEFIGVLPGLSRLYARRTLSAQEAQSIGEPIRAFGDGQTLAVSGSGSTSVGLSLLADRRGGLLISEISQWGPPVQETGFIGYKEAIYFELYNNSDQTIFLDGKTFGTSFHASASLPTPCENTQAQRTDPTGVYAREVLAFPGSGGEYPILPGEVKLIPIAAIDHRPVHPDLFDFSGASFEIRGVSSADNPSVPDMLDIGLAPFVIAAGGASQTNLFSSRRALFLAEAFDPSSLPILYRDDNGRGWVQVPADRIIDVVGLTLVWPDRDPQFPPCAPMIHPDFDRYEGGFLPVGLGEELLRLTYQRRILRFDGQAVLSNTNTSAVDLILHAPTPGTLPPP